MKKDEIVESVCNPEEKDNKKTSVIMGRKKKTEKTSTYDFTSSCYWCYVGYFNLCMVYF